MIPVYTSCFAALAAIAGVLFGVLLGRARRATQQALAEATRLRLQLQEAPPAPAPAPDLAALQSEHDGWRDAALLARDRFEEAQEAQRQMIMDLAEVLGYGDSTTPVFWNELVSEVRQHREQTRGSAVRSPASGGIER